MYSRVTITFGLKFTNISHLVLQSPNAYFFVLLPRHQFGLFVPFVLLVSWSFHVKLLLLLLMACCHSNRWRSWRNTRFRAQNPKINRLISTRSTDSNSQFGQI